MNTKTPFNSIFYQILPKIDILPVFFLLSAIEKLFASKKKEAGGI